MSHPSRREAIRREVRAWLRDAATTASDPRAWRRHVVDAGWAAPSWPVEWHGRGYSVEETQIVIDEFDAAGRTGAGQDRTNLVANTVLAFGDDGLKRRVLRPVLTDELAVCLLYSEPGAGSDLAGVQTTARRDGDEWVVNGQKVWTSGAHTADFGMLIARTDWDVPKHQGLTFFLFPMKQPGVEVRPIKQITGEQHFNEVFITDGRVPDANRLGALGQGWRVLQTALAYERAFMAGADRAPGRGRAEKRADADDPIWGTSTNLVKQAVRSGRSGDAVLRQALARVYSERVISRWNDRRASASLEVGTSSPLPSLAKLHMSGIVHDAARVHAQAIGAEALLFGTAHPRGDAANFEALNAYFTSIGGGTDQIQRNIIGERILGLPKEPDADRDRPFRDVSRAGDRRDEQR